MLSVWRLCKAKREKDTFTAEGARRAGGRWNPSGVPLVYTADTLSLAAVELFVHLDPSLLGLSFVQIKVHVPATVPIETLDVADLPADWRDQPAPPSLAQLGADWVTRGPTALLKVPSAVIDHQHVYLINPQHSDVGQLVIHPAEPLIFDPGCAN